LVLVWRTLVRCVSPLGLLELVILYEMDLTRPIERIEAKVEATLAQATPSDVKELAVVMAKAATTGPDHISSTTERITRRFQRGEICYLAKIGPHIVHYNWISFRSKESLAGRFIVLSEDAAYCGDAYTDEAWRGQAIHTEVNSTMLRFLRTKGFRWAYTWARADNRSSRKTLERVGWKRSGVMMAFTPRRTGQAHIWRISGRLDPFIWQRVPE
jgi:RimJ/RimL family protein N-acetyltransferase